MTTVPISKLELIEEADADSELKETYETIKKTMQLPFVPNIMKSLSVAPDSLKGLWGAFDAIYLQSSLPMALKAMMLYTISATNSCQYCSVVHQATCKSIGVDEETLKMLTENLAALEPRRVQVIVDFAVKIATQGQTLTEADYDVVRDQGVSEEELTEIIAIAALGNLLDTLADAFKIDIDQTIKDAIGG